MVAGREPGGRGRPGRVPRGRVAAQRRGRRWCPEGPVPPVWCAASSVDIVNPRSWRRARRHRFNESGTGGDAVAGGVGSETTAGQRQLAGEQVGGDRDPARP
ncbi:hypothetical protein GA0070624_6072 [Micromonospora rhizosphaerae]|uniref:Uncharacterized protein n=1 Tax=Micromonospora rhizosphaerae TaxID=568872 RepID=A0A1C6T8N3_9ACTN|nr:hypothetical protein GA0070624_6072 [Micromonospora rhizosphaerae]